MSGAFDTPKKIAPPPVPDPPPVPIKDEDTGDQAVKAQQKKSGARKAFKVGNLTPKSTGKKRFLGGA